MNIKRAKEEIINTIEAYLLKDEQGDYVIPSIRQRPVLLIGPPGVGKTQIMEQISRECGIGLVAYTITHHTRQSAVGLPFIEKKHYGGREYTVTEYTMSEIVASIYDKMESTGLKEGILFIDEINCVSETLAPAMLQFLQCKTFGSHRIPQGWVIVAAGNPPEYNKSVREFDVVTLDRIKKITVEPDFEVWKEYAAAQEIHPAILAYLEIRRGNFCRIETTVDGKFFATPRGWEDLSELMRVYERLGKAVDREVAGQYIQFPAIAKDFANYLELYHKYQDDYQVDEILEGTIRETLCDRLSRAAFDERLSVVGLLLSRLRQGFIQLSRQDRILSMVMAQLKPWGADPALACSAGVAGKAEAMEKESQRLKEAGLLSPADLGLRRRAQALLEAFARGLIRDSVREGEDSWNWLCRHFGQESDRYEEQKDQTASRLEHAFDFMEAAFGDSQEMVLFVTELNSGQASVDFLREYNCQRYYEYNRLLLFDQGEHALHKKIDPENFGENAH